MMMLALSLKFIIVYLSSVQTDLKFKKGGGYEAYVLYLFQTSMIVLPWKVKSIRLLDFRGDGEDAFREAVQNWCFQRHRMSQSFDVCSSQ